jgi:hypothetical protein
MRGQLLERFKALWFLWRQPSGSCRVFANSAITYMLEAEAVNKVVMVNRLADLHAC